MQKKSFRFPEKKFRGDLIHTDDLICIAPPEGFDIFQSNLPRTHLKVLKDVEKGEPVTSDNVLIIKS